MIPRYAELSHSNAAKGIGYRFFAAVPIKVKGKSLGVIACNGRLARRLTEQELRLLSSMADQIGPAIDNINLFAELREKTAALETSNHELVEALEQQTEIAKVLQVMASSPTELGSVVATIHHNASRLCEADSGATFVFDGEQFRSLRAHRQSFTRGPGIPSGFADSAGPRNPAKKSGFGAATDSHF